MQPTQRRTFGTKHGSLDLILCGLAFTASFTSRSSSGKTVWSEQQCYKQLYEGERDQIICPSLSISCWRGVLSEGGGRWTSLLGWRYFCWQHRDSAVNQRQAMPGCQIGQATRRRWRQQSKRKREAQATWERGVRWAGKQNLPKASTFLGTLSLTASVNQLSPNYWHLLHQQELYSQHGAQCTVPTGTSAALLCPFLMLTTAEAAHQQKPAFQTALPTLLQPFLSVGPGSQFFSLSSSDISVSLKYSDDLVLFFSPPHQILPLLVEAVDFTQAQEANLHPSGFKIAVA